MYIALIVVEQVGYNRSFIRRYMTTQVWWVDQPKNIGAGGYISYGWDGDDTGVYDVNTVNENYLIGFQCLKDWLFPLDLISDHYWCFTYHTYLKFLLPTTASGEVVSAELYLRMGGINLHMNVAMSYQDIDIYHYIGAADPTVFPYETLDEDDYDTSWNKITSIEDFNQFYIDFLAYGHHWMTAADVTEAVQYAIDGGLDRIALRLSPSYDKPLDWNYDTRPTAYDQEAVIAIYGPIGAYCDETPSGYPTTDEYGRPIKCCSPCPWLKIIYSGGTEQWVPGEDVITSGMGSFVNCVAADPKAKMAIAGTDSGNLWYCWSGGGQWTKVYEAESAITSVWMDYKRNFQDYPWDEIAYFGTEAGELYRSLNSLTSWNNVYDFDSMVVEIMSSDLDPNKVAVGTVSGGVYVSVDGGTSWTLARSNPGGQDFTGLFVRDDEIQATFGGGAVYRSPDFGVTWYAATISGISTARDVGFNLENENDSVVGGNEKLYTHSGEELEGFSYIPAATVSGLITRIDVDWESVVTLIGTTEKLYKTINFGQTVAEVLNVPVADVALGGNEVISAEFPVISAYVLLPNGDGNHGAVADDPDIVCSPSTQKLKSTNTQPAAGDACGGEYPICWTELRDKDAVWEPPGDYVWGTYSGRYVHYNEQYWTRYMCKFEDLDADVEIAELRFCFYGGRSTYPYGDVIPLLSTYGNRYQGDCGELPLSAGSMTLKSIAFINNPYTGEKFTKSQLNNIKMGHRLTSTGSHGHSFIDKIYIEVYPEGENVSIVGTSPIDRWISTLVGSTWINLAHPAPQSGTVRVVQARFLSDVSNCKIGIFYRTEGEAASGYYTCRSYVSLGTVSSGFRALPVALSIFEGDYIGFYGTAGQIPTDRIFNREEAMVSVFGGGDAMGCEDELFLQNDDDYALYIPSIRGIIYT